MSDVRRTGGPDGYTALRSGTVLGRYVVESVIAAGGFGITYLCRHTTLGSYFAVKEHFPRQLAYRDGATSSLRPTDPKDYSWSLERFLDEGRTLAHCAHPGVVTVADVFEHNGTAYMVLGYERGQSFKSWLEALHRAPTQDEIDDILEPLLDALAHVHAQGMLHRDIAPDNIIVRDNGRPCLIDFGSARQAVAERSQLVSAIVKTGYSPPEQYSRAANTQGPWSDIYALGATLYRAVTSTSPPEATARFMEETLRRTREAVADPAAYRPEFLEAIDLALRLKPDERPKSVDQWRALLFAGREFRKPLPQATAKLLSVSATPATSPPFESRVPDEGVALPSSRRSPLKWIAVAVAVMATASAAYIFKESLSGVVRRHAVDASPVAKRGPLTEPGPSETKEGKPMDREDRSLADQQRADERQQSEEQRQREARANELRLREEASRIDEQRLGHTQEAASNQRELDLRQAEQQRQREAQEAARRQIAVEPAAAIAPGSAKSFKDTLSDGHPCIACPELILVPAGSITVGSPLTEVGREAGEDEVRITIDRPYAVGRLPVTFEQWDACAADGGCGGYLPNDQGWGRGRNPVINISWEDAQSYLSWLSTKTGKRYRLLSETEREYATRAGSLTPFWWGTTISTSQANYDGTAYGPTGSKGDNRKRPITADVFQANRWGLVGAHGNSWEWTADCWNSRNLGNPADGSARTTGDCTRRVVKGGSWAGPPSNVRSAARESLEATKRAPFIGVRVARDLAF